MGKGPEVGKLRREGPVATLTSMAGKELREIHYSGGLGRWGWC